MLNKASDMKKISISAAAILSCFIGVGVGIISLNYWHATRCTGGATSEELSSSVEAIERRLLQAESQVKVDAFIVFNCNLVYSRI